LHPPTAVGWFAQEFLFSVEMTWESAGVTLASVNRLKLSLVEQIPMEFDDEDYQSEANLGMPAQRLLDEVRLGTLHEVAGGWAIFVMVCRVQSQ
jgi:hypothetical protein